MIVEFPTIHIWIDLNDPEILTYMLIKEILMKAYLLFSRRAEAWRRPGSCLELSSKWPP